MMKTIRRIGLLSALIALMVVGVSVNASADTVLTIGDAYYVGSIDPDTPANGDAEAGYINILIARAAPSTTTIDSREYVRSATAFVFAEAVGPGVRQDNDNTDNSFAAYQYILGKYGNVAHVWYSATGWDTSMDVILPASVDGDGGLSHTSAFNAVSVPEPGSLSLLLLGLTGVGGLALRRKQ